MYAIIEDSGTQIKVSEGDVIRVDLRDLAENASSLTFDKVLYIGGEDTEATIGQPYVAGATVSAELLAQKRGDKVSVIKFRRRKNYKRIKGHRQDYLEVQIGALSTDGSAPAAPKAAAKPKKEASTKAKATDTPAIEGKFYPIEEIEGIAEANAAKLAPAGIKTTKHLLEKCASAKGRKEVSEITGVTTKTLLKWADTADLMRISGIGKQFSELLKASGVDTIKELRQRNAENLAAALEELNAEKKLAKSVPSASQIADYIEKAKAMEPVITH